MPIRLGQARARFVSAAITLGSGMILMSPWLIGSESTVLGRGAPVLIVSSQFLPRRFTAEQLAHALVLGMSLPV